MLEASIECLRQEQLKNNICVSGVPPTMIDGNNTADCIISIARALNIDITRTQFSSYAVANKKLIIAHFYNLRHKQSLHNKIRVKKSLMVEEVVNTKSNSQIYLNDHLTPYFNKLHFIARNAKKDGKLASASSYGGKIRARKLLDDAPTVITTESQLQALIDLSNSNDNGNYSINSAHHANNISNTSHSTSQNSYEDTSPNTANSDHVKNTNKNKRHTRNATKNTDHRPGPKSTKRNNSSTRNSRANNTNKAPAHQSTSLNTLKRKLEESERHRPKKIKSKCYTN